LPTSAARVDGRLGIDGLVESYGELCAQLQAEPFLYDPRRSLSVAVTELAERLRDRLAGERPVHLVTHGDDRAQRALQETSPFEPGGSRKLNDRRSTVGSRAVLLSPPLEGSRLASVHMAGATELCAALELLNRNTSAG
jgi:hypothetical protein